MQATDDQAADDEPTETETGVASAPAVEEGALNSTDKPAQGAASAGAGGVGEAKGGSDSERAALRAVVAAADDVVGKIDQVADGNGATVVYSFVLAEQIIDRDCATVVDSLCL